MRLSRLTEPLRNVQAPAVLKGLAVLLAALFLVQSLRYSAAAAVGRQFTQALQARAAVPTEPEKPDEERYRELIEKGLFGKEGTPPPPTLFGILGDQALVGRDEKNAKFCKVGGAVDNGYKVVAIGPGKVTVEREGERKDLTLWPKLNAPVVGGNPGASKPAPPAGPAGPPPEASPQPEMPNTPDGAEARRREEEARRRALEKRQEHLRKLRESGRLQEMDVRLRTRTRGAEPAQNP